ncbi:MAG: VPLPA-CTERM sorting domain-containing protein [Paracoccaceae bacterium]
MRSFVLGCLAVLFSLGWAGVGHAVPVSWNTTDAVTLTGFGFSGPASVTLHGSFTYDADTEAFDDISFAFGTRGDVPVSSIPDLHTATLNTPQQIQIFTPTSDGCFNGTEPCPENTLLINLLGPDQLTNVGGVFLAEFQFFNPNAAVDGLAILRGARSFDVVPLPAGMPFLVTGLGILAFLRRKS